MNVELKEFFKLDEDAYYIYKGKKRLCGIYPDCNNCIRNDMAREQAKLTPVPYMEVFSYVNDFLEKIRFENGAKEKVLREEHIELDGLQHTILNNGIIVKNCEWDAPIYDKNKKLYTYHDKKYDIIKEKFNLYYEGNLIWLKFTTKGHLGVVAKGFDINYDNDTKSGRLIKEVDQEWDESFVLIFPLTDELLEHYTGYGIELAVGNYLIYNKQVPIIDYYSHNNYDKKIFR